MSAVLKFCKGCGVKYYSGSDSHFAICPDPANPEWVTKGPYTLEDVADGVPGAAEALAAQATEAKEQTSSVPPGSHYCPDCRGSGSEMNPKAMHLVPCPKCLGTACLHHRSQKKEGHCAVCEQDENCLLCKTRQNEQAISHDTAKEWDESLDSPHDSKARQTAIQQALDLLVDHEQYRGDPRLIEALTKAYDAGVQDTARLINVQMRGSDPMERAIERAKHRFSRDAEDERDLALALNEAYRNGMRQEQKKTPASVKVEIPGISPSGRDHWIARPVQISNPDGTEETVYQIEGDPNAVAVGRFKASLRKFLGIS